MLATAVFFNVRINLTKHVINTPLKFPKVDFQVVSEIRPEGYSTYKRKCLESDSIVSTTANDPEEVYNIKQRLVGQLCRLFNTRGTILEIEDLNSILNLSKSLMNKSNHS